MQLQLFAALCHRSQVETNFKRALYACGPLISAIGLKLQTYRWGSTEWSDQFRGQERVSPQCLVRILVEILRHLPKTQRLSEPEFLRHLLLPQRISESETLLHTGSILKSCYLRGLLSQPADSDVESYRVHVRMICLASNLINVCYNISSYGIAESDRLGHSLESYNTTYKLLQIPVVELMQAARSPLMVTPENVPRADGAVFRVNDLDIGSLKTIGELSIKWTRHWDEHLLLDIVQQKLTVAWFSVDTNYFATILPISLF